MGQTCASWALGRRLVRRIGPILRSWLFGDVGKWKSREIVPSMFARPFPMR